MNRQYELRHMKGTMVILVALALVALAVATLQVRLSLVTEEPAAAVDAISQPPIGPQAETVELPREAVRPPARAWKAEEILSAPAGAETSGRVGAFADQDAVSLQSYYRAAGDSHARAFHVSASRGWKAEEIGAVADSPPAAVRPSAEADALSLGSFFQAAAAAAASAISDPLAQRTWKAAEINASGEAIAEDGVEHAMQEDAQSLGAAFQAASEQAVSAGTNTPAAIRGFQTKLEGLLAEEGLVSGGSTIEHGCQPEIGFGPEPCGG